MPKSSGYPAPLIIPPKSTHKQTAIILHGRGSTAEKFASPLLHHSTSSSDPDPATPSFQSHFPNTKFVFPTASLRRAVAYNRSLIRQWFDMYPLDSYAPEYRQDIQFKGLRESVSYIHSLLKDAVREVGPQNVVLMGLSQGCAISLLALLLWGGGRLGAFVGMCGWLPLRGSMLGVLDEEWDVDSDEVLFERDGDEDEDEGRVDGDKSKFERVVESLREELDFPFDEHNEQSEGETRALGTPVFLGHGREDQKVPFKLGGLAAQFLTEIGVDVRWSEYQGLGHWYSADMLKDVVAFIESSRDLGN